MFRLRQDYVVRSKRAYLGNCSRRSKAIAKTLQVMPVCQHPEGEPNHHTVKGR